MFESMMKVITTDGEAQERAIKETLEKLRVVEERIVEFCPTAAATSIRSENLGLHDIVMFWTLGLQKTVEAAIGVKLICPDKFPLIFSCVEALAEIFEVREMKPDHDKIVGLLQFMRRNALQAPKA
ncbi:uncharacterized protein LOC130755486 [Actinidia eriantha]|uniref:uncharacterized protein LOC130755486 n=1 Tax=Actinidia eriantha TaxID=165200 RepID=UPI0025865F9F|nr:uncharacterized protein LOC130755486 [Actinidia eriantha]